jgi:tetratricopeptide (TPR) repeat protein
MLFAQGNFAAAAECYMSLVATNMRGADLFAKVSQCYGGLGDYARSVEMLDSAVNCFGVDDAKGVAPYVLTRALMKEKQGSYRAAVLDYNRYEELAGGGLGDNFYYLRSQAEYNAKMFQQALNDFDTAIDLAPLNLSYYIEKALLCYRVKLTDEGIRTLDIALELAPEEPNVHYLLGRLYMLKNEDAKGREYLLKAKELGHPDAESILLKMN